MSEYLELLMQVGRCAMRCICPYCSQMVIQLKNLDGPNFCQYCGKLFFAPKPENVPPWVLGVVVVLMANWQIMYRLNMA
jgi:hypothetical protein